MTADPSRLNEGCMIVTARARWGLPVMEVFLHRKDAIKNLVWSKSSPPMYGSLKLNAVDRVADSGRPWHRENKDFGC